MAWNKTAGGIDFVAVKGGQYGSFVFLAPAGGDLVRVGRVEAQRGRDGKPGGGWLQETPALREFAMPVGEARATHPGVRSTKAGSRKRDAQPGSVAMIGYASNLGIEDAHSMGAGDLSMAIDRVKASSVLD